MVTDVVGREDGSFVGEEDEPDVGFSVIGVAEGAFVGEADELDVGFGVIGFAVVGAVVGLTVDGVDVGSSVTAWPEGFVVGINDVGREDGVDVGFVNIG